MMTDRLDMALVEAHKLDSWIRDCEARGGVVRFVVPHGYLFQQERMGAVRDQGIRLTVETTRIIFTMPDVVTGE